MTRAADLAKLIAGGGTITVDDNSENLKLVTTDADANVGPTLRMDRQSASAADGDLLGKVNFVGHNDAGTPEDIAYAGITAIINDSTDGEEDGKLAINTIVAGSEVSRIFIDAGETVFNENGVNVDFRVESDGLTNAFVIDAGNNGIGFGISPRSDLHTSATQMFLGLDGGIISQRDSGLGINGVSLTQNTYIDSDTGNYAYMNTDEASKIHLNDGTIRFDVAASGTAGNAISFSEAMRINSSAAVMIGTTSSPNNAPLLVHCGTNDNIRFNQETHATISAVNDAANAFVELKIDGNDLLLNTQSGNRVKVGTTSEYSGTGASFIVQDSMDIGDGTTSDSAILAFAMSQATGTVGSVQSKIGAFSTMPKINLTCTNSGGGSQTGELEFYTTLNASQALRFKIAGNGDLTATDTSIGSISDERLKKDIQDFTYDLDKFKTLETKSFKWQNPILHGNRSDTVYGTIAQQIESVDADFIIEDNIIETLDNNGTEYDNPDYLLTKDTKGVVKTSKITGKKDAMYISVIQQLISKVETLEAEVAKLKG